jgi:hypothetical protein
VEPDPVPTSAVAAISAATATTESMTDAPSAATCAPNRTRCPRLPNNIRHSTRDRQTPILVDPDPHRGRDYPT